MENKAVIVIEKETKDIVSQAEAIVITNQAQYEGANAFLRADKMLQKKIHEAFDEIVASAHKTWKAAGQKRTDYLEPVLKAEKVVKGILAAYKEKMENLRIEEQRKADLKAEVDAENKRKALAKRSEKWEKKGNGAKAEALREQAEDVQVEEQVVAPKIDKVAGLSFRDNYSAIIKDETLIPREYLTVNTQALDKIGQATKGTIKIPGVEWKCEKIQISRG